MPARSQSPHDKKKRRPPGNHVFQATGTIFELVQNIIGTNLLTRFHDDWTIHMAFRVLTMKNAPPPWRPYIIGTNLVTKFHGDRKINVASRVLIRKNATPPSGHVLKATKTIFELIQDIIGTNLLIKFHEDLKKNIASRPYIAIYGKIFSAILEINVASRVLTSHIGKNAPPPCGHFHEDRTINVASRENAPPLGSHVFQANITIFELIQDIIETNFLAKFHDDRTINVASTMYKSTA
ncbi:hypothetical protein DPMN_151674 [Dreissena polymorpha]|uniref:Uncharacterized protein n=1 Tax=Dreissena polymorpha TaxID=45954 RepID=A0A9D4FFH9_DREPO|nr:hypothetical protein DPMN_151674 [Dreissena polymorpha]